MGGWRFSPKPGFGNHASACEARPFVRNPQSVAQPPKSLPNGSRTWNLYLRQQSWVKDVQSTNSSGIVKGAHLGRLLCKEELSNHHDQRRHFCLDTEDPDVINSDEIQKEIRPFCSSTYRSGNTKTTKINANSKKVVVCSKSDSSSVGLHHCITLTAEAREDIKFHARMEWS